MRLHIMWGCGIALHSLCMAGHGSVWLWICIVAIRPFEYCILEGLREYMDIEGMDECEWRLYGQVSGLDRRSV